MGVFSHASTHGKLFASMDSVPLRRRLILLAAVGILPLAVMSGISLVALFKEQRDQGGQAGLEIARALSIAVDAELRRSISALEVLGTSLHLDDDHVVLFREHANRAVASQPQWKAIILADANARPLMRTGVNPGEPLSPVAEPESFKLAVSTRKPVIGYLAQDTARQAWGLPVRVPVVQDGEVRYVVSAIVKPESILDVVRRQRVPDDWVVTVVDAKGRRVARTRGFDSTIGTPPSPTLAGRMASAEREWRGVTRTTEGDEVYTSFVRLRDSGWAIAIGIPPSAVEAGANRSLAVLGGGIVLSLLLGGVAALVAARSINGPMGELRTAAQSLGEGKPPSPPRTDIREIQEVGEALIASARQRAASEVEREDLLASEKAARAEAEAANRAKDEFLAMLGHELRNPLGAIANAIHILEDSRAGAAVLTRVRGVIARQATHLARLTDDLLDAGRAMMGKIVLRSEPLDLAAAAAEALATLRATGRASSHRIVENLNCAWVSADAIRLEQIISNLVVNAVKYTPTGGTINVSVKCVGGDAILCVSDDGIGLSPELAARAFDLFVQGDRGLDRAEGGLGIGLTLVKRLAQLHGGDASVASAGAGKGSAFTVRFPAIEPKAVGHSADKPRAANAGRRVLVVEDNDDARDTLSMLLEMMGHEVEVARDGVSGVEKALASPPDVALVDVGLPGIDGYEVARRIRARLGGRTLLVALTGYGLPEDRARALDAGFDAHVVKPVDYETLTQVLATSRRGLSEEAPR
jgi:signal transduction histidine kinase/ActR/RegA family two-component response regulator